MIKINLLAVIKSSFSFIYTSKWLENNKISRGHFIFCMQNLQRHAFCRLLENTIFHAKCCYQTLQNKYQIISKIISVIQIIKQNIWSSFKKIKRKYVFIEMRWHTNRLGTVGWLAKTHFDVRFVSTEFIIPSFWLT